jgi:hypothetical protein
MKISDWLDQRAAENSDISQIDLPTDLSYDEEPDEMVFFEEINHCGILCSKNHPYSNVVRYGHWYYCTGQDKKAGAHSSTMMWKLVTKDRQLALKTAKQHIK